jgi:hypothetical protein
VGERRTWSTPSGDDDGAVGGSRHRSCDTAAQPRPLRADDHQLSAAVASELDDPPARRTLENLGLGAYPGNVCYPQSSREDAPCPLHLLDQPPLVNGSAEDLRRATTDVDEDQRDVELGSKADRVVYGRPARGRIVDGRDDGTARTRVDLGLALDGRSGHGRQDGHLRASSR